MELLKKDFERSMLSALQTQMRRLFGDFFGEELPLFRNGETWVPELDIAETPEAIVVTAEIPGIDPKEVQITVRNNHLVLRGEKKEEKETKGRHWIRTERRVGAFRRELALPAEVEEERIEAVSKNGVLTVTLPKKKEAQGKQIPVKTA